MWERLKEIDLPAWQWWLLWIPVMWRKDFDLLAIVMVLWWGPIMLAGAVLPVWLLIRVLF
jgi:hypothetical protein